MNVVGRHLIHCFGKQNVVRCIGSDIHKIIEKVMILYSMILFLRHDRTINPTATDSSQQTITGLIPVGSARRRRGTNQNRRHVLTR